MHSIIQAMHKTGTRRLLQVSGSIVADEGESPYMRYLIKPVARLAEGEPDFGIEAILEHPGPDWYTGVWLDERRGYEGQMRTVTYRDGVYRIESGPENDFWAVVDPPDDEDDEL